MNSQIAGPWTGDQQLESEFNEVARLVYAGDSEWLPEDALQLGFSFTKNNPYFSIGKVWRGFESKQARLAGFYDPRQLVDGENVAYFGFWETVNSYQTNLCLFNAFEDWARKCGATRIYGPINFNTYGLYRIRTSHFDAPCFQGEPYNPEYYPTLLDSLGYSISSTYYSQFDGNLLSIRDSMRPQYESGLLKMENGFSRHDLTVEFWMDNIEAIYLLSEIVFQSNFAYTPINIDIFRRVCGESFISKADPHVSHVMLDNKNNKIAGMLLGFPSWGPLLKQGAAQRISASDIDFRKHFERLPKPRMVLAKTAGVAPEYRNRGLYSVMMYQLVESAIDTGYSEYGAVLAKDDNVSLRMVNKIPNRRSYSLFWKKLS